MALGLDLGQGRGRGLGKAPRLLPCAGPAGSGREQPGSLSLPRVASRARTKSTAAGAPPAGLRPRTLASVDLYGVGEAGVIGTRCVFTGSPTSSSSGPPGSQSPIMAPVLRQETPRSFRWHVKSSWRRKVASRFRGPESELKSEQMPQRERTGGILPTTDQLTRVSDNHFTVKTLKSWSL